jgi:hypothetical protein
MMTGKFFGKAYILYAWILLVASVAHGEVASGNPIESGIGATGNATRSAPTASITMLG